MVTPAECGGTALDQEASNLQSASGLRNLGQVSSLRALGYFSCTEWVRARTSKCFSFLTGVHTSVFGEKAEAVCPQENQLKGSSSGGSGGDLGSHCAPVHLPLIHGQEPWDCVVSKLLVLKLNGASKQLRTGGLRAMLWAGKMSTASSGVGTEACSPRGYIFF